MPLNNETIAIIGCGTMGEATVRGLVRRELLAPDDIIAAHPRPERRDELVETYRIRCEADNRDAVAEAGVHMGFSRRVASRLVFETLAGAVEFAAQSPDHVAKLRNQVTSPGGTTAEACYHLERGRLRTVVSDAVWAAFRRSEQLGRQEPSEEAKGDG
ncbi:MAG: pyrroline-5-carboxylate reductase dimerization domain-containing protein [Acidobacteriota bacterium]